MKYTMRMKNNTSLAPLGHYNINVSEDELNINTQTLQSIWDEFMGIQSEKSNPGRVSYLDKNTGQSKTAFSETRYYRGHTFERDLVEFMQAKKNQSIRNSKVSASQ